MEAAAVAVKSEPAEEAGWHSLGTPSVELRLEWTLPTGQSFRWRAAGEGQYVGVLGQRAVRLRQLEGDVQYRVIARGAGASPAGDAAALADYFNLSTSLAALAPGWAAACGRYAAVTPHLPGARMLRQDPLECLFSFICSQNNHISRIHGMVDRLCARYGTPLGTGTEAGAATDDSAAAGAAAAGKPAAGLSLYAFPTLDQLAAATEEDLRADGFGYRAKFITGSAAQLQSKPGGGAAWLLSLRDVPFDEATEALCTLPGIGPKVAACVCLFSLDKHAAIPVDTHVWDLALKYYTPHLRNKSLTKKVHGEVQAAFVERFGAYAGWAHNTLFIAELASTRERVPALAGGGGGRAKRKAAASSEAGASSSSGSDSEGGDASEASWSPGEAEQRGGKPAAAVEGVPVTPAEGEAAAPARRSRRRPPSSAR